MRAVFGCGLPHVYMAKSATLLGNMQYAFRMTESKAFISGWQGPYADAEETISLRASRHGASFSSDAISVRKSRSADLVARLRDSIGKPPAPVLIDQEGGRVQRIRPPFVQQYPNGAAIAKSIGGTGNGLACRMGLGVCNAFDLMPLGITVDCLPVLDVPVPGSHDVIGIVPMGMTTGDGNRESVAR